ncbi:ABC transporter permease [Mycoplasmopsis synoviae]|nr:ABC transporter permease [Mycoplasmopsis synoviae]AKJ21068.1 Ribose ABC transport system, permease protein RbsC [Mycoplasmopsis synoviae]AQU48405.1 Ribose ABC transport system, permease protein RbsC [Mycoplasmopsis synoviae]AWL83973.1 sugar ABC transporter permease [Mycoplasmopsis synoviae]QLE13702.1 sugar ABC transporter permease [Mycoplasmopsis synoviae]UZF64462.1 ABC transporter permease [Mycoplasmopsis synoviae]
MQIKNKKQNFQNATRNLMKFLAFDEQKSTRRKVYSSLYAIIFGLLITSIIFYIRGVSQFSRESSRINLFSLISFIFKNGFSSSNTYLFLNYFIVFGFSGLGVAFAFKSGLFNIGASGQMLLPAVIFYSMLILARFRAGEEISFTILALGFLIFVIGGFFLGALVGILKSFFRIHEVITTIFFNWIVIYIAQWMFNSGHDSILLGSGVSTEFRDKFISNFSFGTAIYSIKLSLTHNFIIFGVALFILLAIGTWFVLSKTMLGYKIKVLGLNKTNAKYIGLNEKFLSILVFGFSGSLCAIGGFFYIVINQNSINSLSNGPIAIAFESIAIALLALNAPLGVIFTSLFYSMLYTSAPVLQLQNGIQKVNVEFQTLITGLVLFMSALSVMFYKFKPFEWIYKQMHLLFNKKYWQSYIKYKQDKVHNSLYYQRQIYRHYLEHLKIKKQISKEKKQLENALFDKVLSTKNQNSKEILETYADIFKERSEFNLKVKALGFDNLQNFKQSHKLKKVNLKNQYHFDKNQLYQAAHKKLKLKGIFS